LGCAEVGKVQILREQLEDSEQIRHKLCTSILNLRGQSMSSLVQILRLAPATKLSKITHLLSPVLRLSSSAGSSSLLYAVLAHKSAVLPNPAIAPHAPMIPRLKPGIPPSLLNCIATGSQLSGTTI